MKQLVMGLLSGILFLTSCGQPVPATIPVIPPTISPSKTPQPSLTSTPSPEPTATFVPTETPLPQIDLPIVLNPDGTPVLTPWNSLKVEKTKGVGILPKIEDLEVQLGAPSWTPAFLDKLYARLWQAEVNGVPLIQPFDPNTVCSVNWKISSWNSDNGLSLNRWGMDNDVSCKPKTFPFRPVYVFYDGRPTIIGAAGETLSTSIYGVVGAIWNPVSQKTELRTFAISGLFGFDTIRALDKEGIYFKPNYNIKLGRSKQDLIWLIDWFQQLSLQSGMEIYDEEKYNNAFQSLGWYDDQLNHMVIFGIKSQFPVK